MKAFYQDIITQKSWLTLTSLKKQLDFTLIGGWAVYLYTRALKSKDIDIIVDYISLTKLKQTFGAVKNDRLRKYEVKQEGIDIDIYLPHFSNLGIPVEKLIKFPEKVQSFTVLKKELLVITKQKAYSLRQASIKGQKDKIDIIALLSLPDFDFLLYKKILAEYKLSHFANMLVDLLHETKEIPELNFNRHLFAKKKKEIIPILLRSR